MFRLPLRLPLPKLAWTVGDPHFQGFDGESFDFMGEPDRFYNLLSDHHVQINAYFASWEESGADNWTVTEQLGIRVGSHRIHIETDGATLDGSPLADHPCLYRVGDRWLDTVEKFARLEEHVPLDIVNTYQFQDVLCNFVCGYRIKTRSGYDFIATLSRDHRPPYLNLLSSLDRRRWPHGIVGQTADHDGLARESRGLNGEGIIAGAYQDYEVSSLWASDFKFSKFRTAGGARDILSRVVQPFSASRRAAQRQRSADPLHA